MTTIANQLKTVRDFVRYAATQMQKAGCFFGHGTDNAWDEAAALMLFNLSLPPECYEEILSARLTHDEKDDFLSLLDERILKRKPLGYLTNQIFFAGHSIYVDENVLIPRSPMAELVKQHFVPWIAKEKVQNILDLCCGSACIAIACAYEFPQACIEASDIDPKALRVAKKNIEMHHLEHNIQLIQSDLFADVPKKTYDVIIANPPYVDAQDMQHLPEEYLHEPRHALAGGADGTDCIVRILKNAAEYLSKEGVLFIEVGNSAIALENLYPHFHFTWLEFSHGESEIFVITKSELQALHAGNLNDR